MEKNQSKPESGKKADQQNEHQRTSGSSSKNTSYQDIPGIKKSSEQQSENSKSTNKPGTNERNR